VKLALVGDTFPPLRTSGAVQLRDLARELVRQGHDVTVLLPDPDLGARWDLQQFEGARVVRLQCLRFKDVGYLRRTIAELYMPFGMLRSLRRSPVAAEVWDGIIWYSPSIFFGPLIRRLKRASSCKAYMIIRDVFPDWAADLGLIGRGLPYRALRSVADYQNRSADIVGIQSPGNRRYFERWAEEPGRRLEVLHNWLGSSPERTCSLDVATTRLAGRRLFVYAGNMGVAQGTSVFIDLAERMKSRADVGFLFVGRGSEVDVLRELAEGRGLSNVVFHPEIHPDEVPGLYAQCEWGLVALAPGHTSHNIPGKFIAYMRAKLPVLACINPGNDLADTIRDNDVGEVCEGHDLDQLEHQARRLSEMADTESARTRARCRALFDSQFSSERAATQIVEALST